MVNESEKNVNNTIFSTHFDFRAHINIMPHFVTHEANFTQHRKNCTRQLHCFTTRNVAEMLVIICEHGCNDIDHYDALSAGIKGETKLLFVFSAFHINNERVKK